MKLGGQRKKEEGQFQSSQDFRKVMLLSVFLKPVWQACDLPSVGKGRLAYYIVGDYTGWEIMGMGGAVTLKGESGFLRKSSNRLQALNEGGAPHGSWCTLQMLTD